MSGWPSRAPDRPASALTGLRVIEVAGIGPGPFAGMLLQDLGADVIRIDRPQLGSPDSVGGLNDRFLGRGRRSIAIDLKRDDGARLARELIADADVLLEGYRPGVMERLGLGPLDVATSNPGLVYCRLTGWGQTGPLAASAGHDLNFLAASGLLATIGVEGSPPPPPLNVVGDYAGGASMAVIGILAALLERARSGQGQVIDSAMAEGVNYLLTLAFDWSANCQWSPVRGSNFADGGAPCYASYETADGRFVAVGASEPKQFQQLLVVLGIEDVAAAWQYDPAHWPTLRRRLTGAFLSKTAEAWAAVLDGTDTGTTAVLTLAEVPGFGQHVARAAFFERDGVATPVPAPRLGRSEHAHRAPIEAVGASTATILTALGYDQVAISDLVDRGVVARPNEPVSESMEVSRGQ